MILTTKATRLVSPMFISAVFLGCSQTSSETSKSALLESRELESFSIANGEQVRDLQKKMEIARGECARILNRSARANESELDRPILPAILLGKLRTNDDESLNALSSHLSLRSHIGRSPHPLNTYVAAEAIAQIGGKEARAAILRKMQQELDHEELMLCAHVLNRLDDRDVILTQLAKAKVESSDETLTYNIERVIETMSKDDFPTNRKYWPSGGGNRNSPSY